MILEAVGVPSNIINVAREIYNKIYYEINRFDNINDLINSELSFPGEYQISDYKFDIVNMNINFYPHTEIATARMSHKLPNSRLLGLNIIDYSGDFSEVNLSIDFAGPENTTIDELLSYINKKKTDIIVSLTHEFKHAYDLFKNPKESTKDRVKYAVTQNYRFGEIKTLNDLLFNIYFIHSVENLVRPSEFAAALEENNISKKEFYKFITNYKVYNDLVKIKNMTYESLKENLINEVDLIRKTMSSLGLDINKTDDELVEKMLELFYINFTNWSGEIMKDILQQDSSIFERLFGDMSDEKIKYLNKYMKRLLRFSDNHRNFFETLLRQNSIVALKMIKKISKVFSLIQEKEQTNESVVDWDLWHKINSTETKIVTEFRKF
jgi:hypothetical protein